MQLTKEQIQKLIIGLMAFSAVVYGYFAFLLGPLLEERTAAQNETAALDPKIKAARSQMAKTKALEDKSPEATALLDSVKAMIPTGSPIAWVPTKVAEILKKEGIDRVSTRMVNELPEKELTGFSRMAWAVEAPGVDFLAFATAVARLENDEPLMEVHAFEIEAGREKPQEQRASLALHNIIRL
jgi:Tfp pilus assembly protein PilO